MSIYFYTKKLNNDLSTEEKIDFFKSINELEKLFENECFKGKSIYNLKLKDNLNLQNLLNFYTKIKLEYLGIVFTKSIDEYSVNKIKNIIIKIENFLEFQIGIIGIFINNMNTVYKNKNEMKNIIKQKYKDVFYTTFLLKSKKELYKNYFKNIEKLEKNEFKICPLLKGILTEFLNKYQTSEYRKENIFLLKNKSSQYKEIGNLKKTDVLELLHKKYTLDFDKDLSDEDNRLLNIFKSLMDKSIEEKNINAIKNIKKTFECQLNKKLETFLYSNIYFKISYILRKIIFKNKMTIIDIQKIEILFSNFFNDENIFGNNEFLTKNYRNDLKNGYKEYKNILSKSNIEEYNFLKLKETYKKSIKHDFGNNEEERREKRFGCINTYNKFNKIIKLNKIKSYYNSKKEIEYFIKPIFYLINNILLNNLNNNNVISQIIKLNFLIKHLIIIKNINYHQYESEKINKIALKEINEINRISFDKPILNNYLDKLIKEKEDLL